VGLNPSRTGLLDVLEAMGARVRIENRVDEGEPRGDVTVSAAPLVATTIAGALVPRLIDELPVVMVMATQARGRTVIRDAKELRVKESDRLAAMGETLARAGAKIELFEDGCAIDGPTPLRGGSVASLGDHRLALTFAIAGLIAAGHTTIGRPESVAVSYPSFFADLERIRS